MGNLYFHQMEYSKAFDCYNQALSLNEELGAKRAIATNLTTLGNIYTDAPDSVLLQKGINTHDKYVKALDMHNKCLQIGEEIGDLRTQAQAWENLSFTYEKQKYYDSALTAYRNFYWMNDSIAGEEVRKGITRKEMEFALDKKETEFKLTKQLTDEKLKQQKQELLLKKNALELSDKEKALQKLAFFKQQAELEKEKQLQASQLTVLNQEKALQAAKLKNQKLQRNLFIAGGTLVLILLFGFFYTYQINQTKTFLEVRNKIARDLHDDVGSTLSSISLYSDAANYHMERNEQAKVGDIMKVIGDNSREMIEDMSDIVWAVNPDNDRFDKLISRLKSHGAELFGAKGINFHFKANEALKGLQLDMKQRKNLYLICKEALNNTAKYATCKTAELAFSINKNELVVLVKDDGKGFDTRNEKRGNGLKNMKIRAEEMKAQFSILSAEGASTEIILKLKIT